MVFQKKILERPQPEASSSSTSQSDPYVTLVGCQKRTSELRNKMDNKEGEECAKMPGIHRDCRGIGCAVAAGVANHLAHQNDQGHFRAGGKETNDGARITMTRCVASKNILLTQSIIVFTSTKASLRVSSHWSSGNQFNPSRSCSR
jgi:hypothetical protein